jgi:cytochrome b561
MVAGISHEAHEILAFVMIALLVLHIAAALRHHFILKDGIMARMLG